jgi:hypothetical protein
LSEKKPVKRWVLVTPDFNEKGSNLLGFLKKVQKRIEKFHFLKNKV